MTKLLIIILIVAIAFWLGRMSVTAKKDNNQDKKNNDKDPPVIDIKLEDKK